MILLVLAPALLLALASCGIAGKIEAVTAKPGYDPIQLPTQPGGPGSSASASSAPVSWQLSWQDNFTEKDLSTNWTFTESGQGFGNDALNWFGQEGATIAPGGGLVITAAKGSDGHTCWNGPCQYTSTEMTSKFSQEYGRFEARIKIPNGTGLWPAFWLIPQDNHLPGEIDVIESNNKNPDEVTGYVHDGSVYDYKAEKVMPEPIGDQYHVYGVDWTPSGVTWTLDGKAYAHLNKFTGWPLNQPFVVIIDLAVGGNWAGAPAASTVFPATMQVSWVRVYKIASLRGYRARDWLACGGGCLLPGAAPGAVALCTGAVTRARMGELFLEARGADGGGGVMAA